jgi:hypothetical protein
MEVLFDKQFNWFDLGVAALFLLLVYFLLQFLQRIIVRAGFLKNLRFNIQNDIHKLLLFYEPLVFVILIGIFVFINPVLHGTLLLLLVLLAFKQLRNYMSGRVIQINKSLSAGKKIKVNAQQGVISAVGRQGIELQTDEGLHFIPYLHLQEKGYTIISGQEIGGFYQLEIIPQSEKEKSAVHLERLMNLLASTPYLDMQFKPELSVSGETIQARVLLKEENHLSALLPLIEDWGYQAKVINLI